MFHEWTFCPHDLNKSQFCDKFEDRFVSSLLQAKCLFQIRACDSQDVYALQSLAARGVSGADVLLRH